MPSFDIFLIGAVNYDIYVPHTNNSVETSSSSDDIRIEIGGGAPITAVALANLGMSPAIAGSIGKHADILLRELDSKGVKHFFKQYEDIETAITVADHYPDGKKRYRADTRSNRQFSPGDMNDVLQYVKGSRMVMRTGYSWMPQIGGRYTAGLFDYARQNGVTTALDMSNPDSWDKTLLEELVTDVVPNIDLLCANEKELNQLARKQHEPKGNNSELEDYMTPERVLEFSHRLLDKGVRIVNLHYGQKGTVLVTKNGYVHEMPPNIKKYTNPTGCGNLQNAGVIYCMLNSKDFGYTARFANAMAVLRLEGNSFPTLEEAENSMKK